jgi:hypothetical protein
MNAVKKTSNEGCKMRAANKASNECCKEDLLERVHFSSAILH